MAFFNKYKQMVRNRNAIDMELLIAVTRPRYFKPNFVLVLQNTVIMDGTHFVVTFHNSITVLPADEGRSIVLLNTSDYTKPRNY